VTGSKDQAQQVIIEVFLVIQHGVEVRFA